MGVTAEQGRDKSTGGVRVGLLYPTQGCGEDDYVALAERMEPAATVEVAYVPWGEGVDGLHTSASHALQELGEPSRLTTALAPLRAFDPEVVTWACSSGSFLCGHDGAHRQAQALREQCGVPSSSTSLAFEAGVHALGVSRVAVGSVYNQAITDAFIDFLATSGITTVHRVDVDAGSDRELANWPPARLLELVDATAHADAEAVLIPETALHTTACLPDLEARAGKPVLTATHVTIWHALQQAGHDQPDPGLGALFAGGVMPVEDRRPGGVAVESGTT